MSLISTLQNVGLELRLGLDDKLIIKGLDRMEPGTARAALAYARRHKADLINELKQGAGETGDEFSIKGLPDSNRHKLLKAAARPLVRCGACGHFTPIGFGDQRNGLGSCCADPWDGHPGQWPHKQHPCVSYLSPEQTTKWQHGVGHHHGGITSSRAGRAHRVGW
jgi:hypothetical protein